MDNNRLLNKMPVWKSPDFSGLFHVMNSPLLSIHAFAFAAADAGARGRRDDDDDIVGPATIIIDRLGPKNADTIIVPGIDQDVWPLRRGLARPSR
jgi:hypothetical protein